MSPPMMSVTSASSSSCSSMRAASSSGLVDLDFFLDVRLGGLDRLLRALRPQHRLLPAKPFPPPAARGAITSSTGGGGVAAAGRATGGTCSGRARVDGVSIDTTLPRIRRDDRVFVEVVKLASGFGTDALGAKFRFCHGRNPSFGDFTWLVGVRLSIAHASLTAITSQKRPVTRAAALIEQLRSGFPCKPPPPRLPPDEMARSRAACGCRATSRSRIAR